MSSIEKIKRYIAVAATASHNRMSVFAPVDSRVHPTHGLQVFPVEDEFTLGVLQSDVHLQWMRARSTSLKADPRFTTTLVTHTFPWPQSGNEALLAAVEEAAAEILDLRAQRFDAGVPLGDQYDGLRLPGKNPLRDLHHRLDEAVRALYGLEADEPDIVRTLLALNHELASDEEAGRSVIGPATRPARSALTEHAFPFA